ncbi:MAG: voltage-gated potassium channel Kch [Phenylobacterium sp.]|jgi:voltage-gated potassium channel Kch
MIFNQNLFFRLGWRSFAAVMLFFCGFIGLVMGVSMSERPSVVEADLLTKAYYCVGLFLMGGMDLGTPVGGPFWGRCLLWLAYLGSPFIAASALVEAIFRALAPKHWQLKKIKNHIIVVGTGDLTMSYLKILRQKHPKVPIVVIDNALDAVKEEELKQLFKVLILIGDITHDYFLQHLHIDRAHKVLVMGNNSFQSYEAAHRIIKIAPEMKNQIVIHCEDLRFMRSMENSHVAQLCHPFNSYHLAASGLVKSHLIEHFHHTAPRDLVIVAGFGRFGQTILEELHKHALNEIESVAIIDVDAKRRVMVADEQLSYTGQYKRSVFEGDISHPRVWKQLQQRIDLNASAAVIILGTGAERANLRTAIWLRSKYPEAMIIARTNQASEFAYEVGREHNITSVSMTELIEDNIPDTWVDMS